MRTKRQRKDEITRLVLALTYIPRHTALGESNALYVAVQYGALTGAIVRDQDRWPLRYQEAYLDATDWLHCRTNKRPSSCWDIYRPSAGGAK